MTTYTAIPNSDVDQDSPVTQTLITLLRDNPIAITEGASGAPKVQSKGLNIYAQDGLGPHTNLDDISLLFATVNVSHSDNSTTTGSAQYRLSSDNGSTWGSWVTMLSVTTFATSLFKSNSSSISLLLPMAPTYNAIEFQAVNGGSGTTTILSATILGVQGV